MNKNRIFYLVFIFALAGVYQASAQTARMGIKGGLNASNLYVNEVNDENARIGFHVGFYGQVLSTETVALQLELLYSTKGAKTEYRGFFDQDVTFNLNYIELPVLAVFKVGDLMEIHAGGYGSYLVGANISYEGAVTSTDRIDRDNLKSFDYGLALGLGVNFGNVQVGGRYNYGLAEIADSNEARVLLGNAKNSAAQLFISFNLNNN